jgi:Aspartyl protease
VLGRRLESRSRVLQVVFLLIASGVLVGCGGPKLGSVVLVTSHVPCDRPPPAVKSGLATVPIGVSRSGSDGALVTVGVCIGRRGPFTFLVDSGTTASIIDESLANQLPGERGFPANTDRCEGLQGTKYIAQMRIGPQRIEQTDVAVANLRSVAKNLSGIIGADILDKFGVVRIDYDKDTMTIGSEKLATASRSGTTVAKSVPQRLRAGTVTAVPMSVSVKDVNPINDGVVVRPSVPISLDGKPDRFVLDTGAEFSAVSPRVASSDLPADQVGKSFTIILGLGCHEKAKNYRVDQLAVGSASAGAATLASMTLPPDVDGLFGSGTLQDFSPVVLDFTDGTLLLGPRRVSPLRAAPSRP